MKERRERERQEEIQEEVIKEMVAKFRMEKSPPSDTQPTVCNVVLKGLDENDSENADENDKRPENDNDQTCHFA